MQHKNKFDISPNIQESICKRFHQIVVPTLIFLATWMYFFMNGMDTNRCLVSLLLPYNCASCLAYTWVPSSLSSSSSALYVARTSLVSPKGKARESDKQILSVFKMKLLTRNFEISYENIFKNIHKNFQSFQYSVVPCKCF